MSTISLFALKMEKAFSNFKDSILKGGVLEVELTESVTEHVLMDRKQKQTP